MITIEDVQDFQNIWGKSIIQISTTYKNGGNYIDKAKEFITNFYAYENENVLFKPTLVSELQFRLDKVSALSYFIGNNPDFPEDSGFAIKPWKSIRWENVGFNILSDCAICMGNYYFGKENENELKVEFSIVLKEIDNTLKIILHDSHLPYQK